MPCPNKPGAVIGDRVKTLHPFEIEIVHESDLTTIINGKPPSHDYRFVCHKFPPFN
jgi:hypothetical protein